MKTIAIALLLCGGIAASAHCQSEGRFLTDPALEGFSQTKAKRFNDFVGRAVLIEFFAYW